MVKVEIVRKLKSWFRLGPTSGSTTASVKTSTSENFIICPGLFGFEELRKPKELYLIKKNAFKKAEILIRGIKKEKYKSNLAMVCGELIDPLCRVRDLSHFIMSMFPKNKFSDVAKRVYLDCEQFFDRLSTDRKFYYFLKKAAKDKNQVLKGEQFDNCDVDRFLSVLEHKNVFHKKEKEIEKLTKELTKYFDTIASFVCTLDWQQSIEKEERKKQTVRNTLYSILVKLLHSRLEFAKLKGFSTYADFSVAGTIAVTPDFVMQFLLKLNKLIRPEVDRDLQGMIEDNKFSCKMESVKYLISKSEKFFCVESCVKDYFSLDTCMEGLKLILSSLYDVIFEKIEDKDIIEGELWHGDVKKYCFRQGNEILGHIYFDFFARCNKPQKRFLIQTSRMCEDGTCQKPVVVISFSFPKPVVSQSLLLNICDIHNLFLQMGNVMHDILEQNKYGLYCRESCASDLYYVPSKLMTYFAYDSRVLRKFAKHYQTREVIPDDIIEKLQNCRKKYYFHKSQKMVFDALVDQACHCFQYEPLPLCKTFHDARNEIFGSFEKPLTFSQERECIYLVHKAEALNYSNLMSEAIASLIWQKYFKNDPLSRMAGEQHRKEFLARSSLIQERVLVESYLQMKLTPECLANAFAEQFLNPM